MRHGQGTGGQDGVDGDQGAGGTAAGGAGPVGNRSGPSATARVRIGGLTPVVLAIGGTDPSGGAGLAADLRTLAAHHVHGALAVTLVTVQSTTRVEAVEVLGAERVRAQIDAVAGDFEIAAVKTGALGDPAIVQTVAGAITTHGWSNVVIDPVAIASVGTALGAPDLVEAIGRWLLPVATLITPNLAEAAVLTGEPVESADDMERAARTLVDGGARGVLVTGGHLAGDTVVDVLAWDGVVTRFPHPRVHTRHSHGTGCTLASAVAARLAQGDPVPVAVGRGLRFVERALSAAPGLGRGSGPLGLVEPED